MSNPPNNPYNNQPNQHPGQMPAQPQQFQQPAMMQGPAPQFQPAPPQKNRSWFARHKVLTGVLGLVVVSALAKGVSGGGSTTSSDSPATTAAAAKEPAGTAASQKQAAKQSDTAATMPKVGTVVHHKKYDFTISSVKCGVPKVGDEYVNTEAQGQFCLVKLTIKNTGNDESTFMADDQKVLDKDGKEYSYSSEATIYASGSNNKTLWLESINPGNSVSGTLVYDLPKGVKPVKIHMTDGGFTDQGVDIALA